MHVVYIVRCADGSLYTGYARDVEARARQHNAGRGARYTRGRGPVTVVYTETFDTHGAALIREAAIKRLPRAAKLRLASPAPSQNREGAWHVPGPGRERTRL